TGGLPRMCAEGWRNAGRDIPGRSSRVTSLMTLLGVRGRFMDRSVGRAGGGRRVDALFPPLARRVAAVARRPLLDPLGSGFDRAPAPAGPPFGRRPRPRE